MCKGFPFLFSLCLVRIHIPGNLLHFPITHPSINDAVAAAPNNTNGSNGYFMIFITAGVYEEYVSIPKNKKYLMMVGAGINQTVITGNRSVVDGWTTFNSATFGKHSKPKYIRDIASMISPSWNNYQLQFVILNAFILQLWLHQTSWR